MSDFGDWEADDAHDTEPADPEQVAMRVHAQRAYLSELAGEEMAAWHELSDEEQEIAIALGDRLVHFLSITPHAAAVQLHEAIAWLSGQPEWDDLDDDVQQMAIAIVDDIIAWLHRQGSHP